MTNVKTVSVTLASAVVTGGTFTVTCPAGTTAGTFKAGTRHQITALGAVFTNPEDFGITTFGSSTVTVTWRHTQTLPANTVLRVGLDCPGITSYRDDPPVFQGLQAGNVQPLFPVRVTLGSPAALSANAICLVGGLPQSGTASMGGSIVTNGVAVLDVPRNITIGGGANLNSTVFTVTGTDVYGLTLIEAITGQVSTAATKGAKAFKTVNSIVLSGTSLTGTSAVVGFGDVLGLPVHLPATGAAYLVGQLTDNAVPTTGTFVAGLDINTVSTATTADVRGTVLPNDATNGSRAYEVLLLLSDPTFKGVPQYDG